MRYEVFAIESDNKRVHLANGFLENLSSSEKERYIDRLRENIAKAMHDKRAMIINESVIMVRDYSTIVVRVYE